VDSVKSLVEENRNQLKRLMDGALVHLGYYAFDVSVIKRKGVDLFDPDTALYTVKADTNEFLSDEDVSFVRKNLLNSNIR
jgi:hypothetical protein